MGKINSKLKNINYIYENNFTFKGKQYTCKVLEIISSCRFKVVFKYKKELYTWKIKLIGCNDNNITNNKIDNAKKYLETLVLKTDNIAKIICSKLEDGYINVIMKLRKEKKTVNDLLIDKGYDFNIVDVSTFTLDNSLIDYDNTSTINISKSKSNNSFDNIIKESIDQEKENLEMLINEIYDTEDDSKSINNSNIIDYTIKDNIYNNDTTNDTNTNINNDTNTNINNDTNTNISNDTNTNISNDTNTEKKHPSFHTELRRVISKRNSNHERVDLIN